MSRSDDDKRGVKYIQLALEGGALVLRVAVEQDIRAMNLTWPSWYAKNKEAVDDFISSVAPDPYQFQNAMDWEDAIPDAVKEDDGTPSLDIISLFRLLDFIDKDEAQEEKVGEFFKSIMELFNVTDIAIEEGGFDDKIEKPLNDLTNILSKVKALTGAKKSGIRRSLDGIAYRKLSEISDEQVKFFIDMKQQMAQKMQKLTESNNNNDNNNDVNVKLFGVEIGTDEKGKYFIEGVLDDTTRKNLILLDKGMGGGSVNVTMRGGKVGHSKTGKVMFNDKGRSSKD